jgi:hypothetical protein
MMWKEFSSKKQRRGVTLTRLAQSCSEQFSDRRAFGVCAAMPMSKAKETADADASRRALTGRIAHYSFDDVFRSDWAMRECLENGGKWEALSRDSDEFRHAQLRHDLLDAQAQIRKLGGKAPDEAP